MFRFVLAAVALALLTACAATRQAAVPPGWPDTLAQLMPADILLLGEQHDAPEHHAMEVAAVQWLAGQRRLGALVIEMASAGASTAGLATSASTSEVRTALQWNPTLWPWDDYADTVMAAVRAGAPVLGGNLPRADMRAAMANPALDHNLPATGYAAQLQAVREGHCDLLPEAQLPGMVRIQIARDQRMAQVATEAVRRAPGKTVLLVAGGGHVLRNRGIPMHLPKELRSKVVLAQAGQAQDAINLEADWVQPTAPLPESDPCAPLRETQPAAAPAG